MRFARFVSRGYGVCAATIAAVVGLMETGGAASAQTVFEGQLSAAEKADAVAWSTLYWQRVDQGGGSPGTGFAFTSTAMQSQLFNLLRGGRTTLVAVGKFGSDACDQMAQPELPAGSADITSIRTAYRDLMLYGEIATNAYQNPGGTIAHANLILSTPPGFGVGVYVGGNDLVSVNLPLKDVDVPAYEATLAMNTSQETQDAISAMISSGATWAGLSGTVTQAQKHITGQASRADNFAALAEGYLSVVGMTGTSVEVISAQYGVYGELPVVAVQLGDALVLMDPVNGNLSGPFAKDSKLDATGLLSAHAEYVPGQPVEYYSAAGCPVVVVASWGPWPGPGTEPSLTPGIVPPATPVTPAGGGGKYTCTPAGMGACTCIRTPTMTPPLPAGMIVQQVCQTSPAGCGPNGSCNGPAVSPTPSGDVPGGGTGCNAPVCHLEYK